MVLRHRVVPARNTRHERLARRANQISKFLARDILQRIVRMCQQLAL
jgi:hypothetical protein